MSMEFRGPLIASQSQTQIPPGYRGIGLPGPRTGMLQFNKFVAEPSSKRRFSVFRARS
jgi:hypothetical protein